MNRRVLWRKTNLPSTLRITGLINVLCNKVTSPNKPQLEENERARSLKTVAVKAKFHLRDPDQARPNLSQTRVGNPGLRQVRSQTSRRLIARDQAADKSQTLIS
jgi:hypothetical protein